MNSAEIKTSTISTASDMTRSYRPMPIDLTQPEQQAGILGAFSLFGAAVWRYVAFVQRLKAVETKQDMTIKLLNDHIEREDALLQSLTEDVAFIKGKLA